MSQPGGGSAHDGIRFRSNFTMRSAVFGTLLVLFSMLGTPGQAAPVRVETARESFLSGGRKISVETFAPPGADRLPAVIVLHSAAGTLVGKGELQRFSRALAAQGKVAFLVRYFDRTGTIFADDAAIDRFTRTWMETVRDAVNFAASHPRVRPDSLGLFGYSLGAYLAVSHSGLDRRIDAVVEVAGGIFSEVAPRVRRLPPTLILHGDADERVKVSEAYKVQRLGRRLGARTELKVYGGEGHRLSAAAMQDASQRALAFFGRHLSRSGSARH